MMEDVFNQSTEKLEARVVHVSDGACVEATKMVDNDNNKWLIRRAFRWAPQRIMSSVLNDDSAFEALESTITKVATSDLIVQAGSNMVVKEIKRMAPVSKFVVEQAKKDVDKAAQQSVLVVPPSPLPSPGSSSSQEEARKPPRLRDSPQLRKTSTSS